MVLVLISVLLLQIRIRLLGTVRIYNDLENNYRGVNNVSPLDTQFDTQLTALRHNTQTLARRNWKGKEYHK